MRNLIGKSSDRKAGLKIDPSRGGKPSRERHETAVTHLHENQQKGAFRPDQRAFDTLTAQKPRIPFLREAENLGGLGNDDALPDL